MSPKILHKIIKPTFLSRLSQVVFLQIVFVFGALAIVLLFPFKPADFGERTGLIEEKLRTASKRMAALINLEMLPDSPTYLTSELKNKMEALLFAENWIMQADVFISDLTGKQVMVYSYNSDTIANEEHYMKPPALNIKSGSAEGVVGPVFTGEDFLVYYYPFTVGKNRQAFLSVAVNHDMIFSNRGQVQQALLLIFLGGTLISLFTVYLVMKWYRNPLNKLIQRISKTAEGGIYYHLEADGDNEAEKLTRAFNEMSAQLYDNQKELEEYHSRLSEANRTLLTSKNFLSALINFSPNCLIVASEDRQILIFSKEALKTFGFENDLEIVGSDVQELFAQSIEDLIASHGSTEGQRGCEALCWRQNKTMFPAFVTIAPIEAGESHRKAYLYIVRDISDSKSFQQMMIRLNKNYSRGEMAGDIAHDINNYLAILLGNLELIPMILKKNQMEKVDQKLEQMKNTLDKIGKYAAGLMDSEHDELFFERIHINQVIENVLAFIRPQKRYAGIILETTLSTEIPAFDADSAKMQQMLVNLLSNSCDAVSTVEGEKKIQIKTLLTDDKQCIRVEVCDNGTGVHEEIRRKLFQERFTTKRKGHGIGLITCRKIVEAHKGHVGTDFSNGSRFYVELPVNQASPAPRDVLQVTPEPAQLPTS